MKADACTENRNSCFAAGGEGAVDLAGVPSAAGKCLPLHLTFVNPSVSVWKNEKARFEANQNELSRFPVVEVSGVEEICAFT